MRKLLGLAVPLVAGHAGNQLMSVVDTAMVGRLGPAALAGVALGNGIYFTLAVFGLGCVVGTEPLVSQAVGAGEYAGARRILRAGIRVAWWIGVPLTILLALAPSMLGRLGVDPETTGQMRSYLFGRLPNAVPFLIFAAQRAYLQARGRTRPIVVAMVAANVVNFVANALLIYGDAALQRIGFPALGLPALGVLGAGIASTLASLLSLAILAQAVRRLRSDQEGETATHQDPRALMSAIFRLGTPLGLQMLAEVGAFATAGVLAGRMSAQAAAGHQVALTLASITFTVTMGLGAATAVRVGAHVGRGDSPGARRAGLLGLATSTGFMSAAALLFLGLAHPLARALTNDPTVLAVAVPLVRVAAVFQLSDGLQVVAAGALRGAGDTRVSLAANLAGHYALGLPVAIVLGFSAHLGVTGLWWGLSIGLTAVAVGLTARFWSISSRPIARV